MWIHIQTQSPCFKHGIIMVYFRGQCTTDSIESVGAPKVTPPADAKSISLTCTVCVAGESTRMPWIFPCVSLMTKSRRL